MKDVMPSVLLFLLFSFLLKTSAESGEFPLKVNDVSGLQSPWPLIASIPFPEGELRDPGAMRIVSKGREVPSQVDIAATWRDGSIRWVLAGFTASPGEEYRVEYGTGVRRRPYPRPLLIKGEPGGDFTVDTGAAVYQFDRNKLLPENAWLLSGSQRTLILQGAGAGAYLLDNSGRMARVAGRASEIASEVLKEGPGRFAVKRSGWYVTDTGEKIARAVAWLYFAQGSPHVRITHSLIFTEDTNSVWFKDYGLEFKTPGVPENAYFAAGMPGEEEVKKVETGGDEAFIMQDTYPHFAEREYRAVMGVVKNGQETILEEFPAAGDWAHGDYGSYGITLAMPWLSERFPKEISFGKSGARGIFWSGRCGRELDFRGRTLVDEYWQTWAKKGYGRPDDKKIDETRSNAQGATRTHDIWFLPRAGRYNEEMVKKTGIAGARQPLVLADTAWLCQTEATGWPTRHKDTEKLGDEERLLSDLWTRLMLPLKAFPMNGFISWGCYPDISYPSVGGRIMPSFGDSRLTGFMDYGLRKAPFLMYARSGERRYYDYGRKLSRFAGDYAIAHHEAPGKKKGAFIMGSRGGLPFFWEGNTHYYHLNDGEIRHWLNDYYLTGDERSIELVRMVKDSIAGAGWPESGRMELGRIMLALSIMDWDENAVESARKVFHSMIDMESQNALKGGGYGAIYKDHSKAYALAEYYMETGDELVKTAFLKLLDQRYRFDRRYNPLSHRMYDGVTHSLAYWMTGEERHLGVVEQTIGDALYYSREYPLEKDLAGRPADPLEWRSMPPFLGQHEYHNPFTGFPTAFKLLAENGWSGKRAPVMVKALDVNGAGVLFRHNGGKETLISLYFTTLRSGVKPEVFHYPDKDGNKPLKGISVNMEKRVQWPERVLLRDDDIYHAYITIPEEVPVGLYLLSLGGNEPFTLLDINTGKAALHCPEGFWSASGSPIRRKGEGAFGRSGEGAPMFFRVPANLEELKLFMGSPACVRRPDGSVAVEKANENIGEVSIPVKNMGGTWSIEPRLRNFKGNCSPSFFRLLNVEPVVAFGTPAFLPEGAQGKPLVLPERPPAPSEEPAFVPGISGQALHLSGGKTLSFKRGAAIGKGGHEFFPGTAGTVEFWFRADMCSHESPRLPLQTVNLHFIGAPHINFLHRSWFASTGISSMQQVELLPETGNPQFGFQGEHFFRAGEWMHLAYTWDIRNGELSIFLNGSKLSFLPAGYGVHRGRHLFEKSKALKLADSGEEITIGPFNGAMDMLRISDSVRYAKDFLPTEKTLAADKNTRALFLFDGNMKGSSYFSSEPAEAE